MKIIINASELKDVLNKANKLKLNENEDKLISIKTSKLNRVEFKICNHISNMQIDMTLIDVQILEQGAAVIPYELINILAYQNGEEFTITDDELRYADGYIKVLEKNTKFEDLGVKGYKQLCYMHEDELYRLIKNVSYCTANDETRPILTGINFNKNKVAAIDGYRLAVAQSNEFNINKSITLSQDLIKFLNKILNKKSKQILTFFLDKTGKYIRISLGMTIVTSKLMEGDFISFDDIIPKESTCKFKIDAREFNNKLKVMCKTDFAHANILKMILNNSNIEIIKRLELAVMSNKINVSEFEGNKVPFKIAANPVYLRQALNKYDSPVIKFINDTSPILISDSKNLDLILPIRLDKESM